MSYVAKSDAIASIKSRSLVHDGEKYTIFEAYLGTDPHSHKPVRKAARSEAKLRKRIAEFYSALSFGGDCAVLLNAYESADARNALDLLKKAGSDLSLTECVRRVLNGENGTAECKTTLAEAYARYETAQEGKSDAHRKAVKARVGAWVEKFGPERLLSDVTAREVHDELESRLYDPSRTETKTTYNNHLGYVKTFMSWCADGEQAFMKSNPLSGMKPKTKEWREPEFVKADDAARIFSALWERREEAPSDLAYAVLSFFCGMRREEIQHVSLGREAVNIDLEEGFIRVIRCKGTLKGVKPRCFTIPDTAMAWMRAFPFEDAVSTLNRKFRDHLLAVCMELGITLPKNAGRHTFITMYSAAYKDQASLTKIAGNSEDVRCAHYDGVSNEREGKAYFAILPPVPCVSQPAPGSSPLQSC